MTKIVYIDEENLHIFRTTRGMSIKFTGKMCRIMLILKTTQKQGFTFFLENTVLENPFGSGSNLLPPFFIGVLCEKTDSIFSE